MLTEIELFECFNVELPGKAGYLWEVKRTKPTKPSMKIEKLPGEPGTPERIELYRQRIEAGLPLFEEE